jgi:hypothetical protein
MSCTHLCVCLEQHMRMPSLLLSLDELQERAQCNASKRVTELHNEQECS